MEAGKPMADAETNTPKTEAGTPPAGRSKDEVALELMKFVAATTGYGKPVGAGAGFSSKPSAHSAEEYAESLLGLFQRCRRALDEDDKTA
jgi:hypothetical protein